MPTVEGYSTLAAALDLPVAAGEASFTRYDFRDLFVRHAVDIIQPNACRTGGLSEVRKIAAMSSAFIFPMHFPMHRTPAAVLQWHCPLVFTSQRHCRIF